MDISTILPLLAGSGKNSNLDPQKVELLKTLSEGKKLDAASMINMLSKNNEGLGKNMQLVNVLSMMQQSRQKEKPHQKSPHGLKPVKAFCPEIFLGRLIKYFDK